jgi:hypothetical protein
MKLFATTILGLCFATFWYKGPSANQSELGFNAPTAMLQKAFRDIKNPNSSEKERQRAIEALGEVVEPASFWANIANDSAYTPKHRGQCVQQLILRHMHAGMTLHQFGKLFNGASWLDSKKVYNFELLGGYIPVEGFPGSDSIFSAITPDPEMAVYISILGNGVSQSDIVRVFKGEQIEAAIGTMQIHDVWPRKKKTRQ